jgi:hypothetical protein
MGTKLFAFLLLTTQLVLAQADTSLPAAFWRNKENVMRKITEDRTIVVSVNAKKRDAKMSNLDMVGGGLTRQYHHVAFAKAQKYENLKKVSDHIREVRWDAAKSELYVHTEAFRYHARMRMRIRTVSPTAEVAQIHFEVIEGNFKGMVGLFSFEKFKAQSCLMGFQSRYVYEKLPMPNFFVEFGLELVLQKVAGLMCQFLEKP